MAVVIASKNPASVFGAKYTASVAPGATELEAMCLNASAEDYQNWTRATHTCALQRIGEPVDIKGMSA